MERGWQRLYVLIFGLMEGKKQELFVCLVETFLATRLMAYTVGLLQLLVRE